ncbi:MAG TPA: O-antigen ligase family protein [Bacteroides sp.]|nr:O-antigen ligase family protein [Bacteroides sp.]
MRLNLANNRETYLVYLFSFLFIAINAVTIALEFYYFSLVPLALLIILVTVYSLDKLIYLAVFVVPLSFQLTSLIPGSSLNLSIPSEPLLAGILIFSPLKYLFDSKFDKKILYHPVSIAILFNLVWIFITSITSTMPLVSFKFLISRLWFIVAFYLIATQIFRKIDQVRVYTWMYALSLLIVVGYAWSRLIPFGFLNQQAAHWVAQPFYTDHTSYGAVLAMLIPVFIGFVLTMKDLSLIRRVYSWAVLAVFLTAVLFSYTRAAWVSLIGALGVFFVIRLRIKFVYLAILGFLAFGYLYSQRTQIIISLEQNRQDSSEDLAEHVRSISNVATDVSNMERLNRWSCAWRMFKEKPVFGWGPGTYMFQYASFQIERGKTEISTNAATLGNAHSEYIGPLAESGIFGPITFLSIVLASIFTGLKNWYTIRDRKIRILSLSLVLGLITYYLHGLLNNFLDTDKASVLFWGFTAAIVAISVYHREPEEGNDPAAVKNSE